MAKKRMRKRWRSEPETTLLMIEVAVRSRESPPLPLRVSGG